MRANVFRLHKSGLKLVLSFGLADQALASASYDSSIDVMYTVTLTDSNNPTPNDNSGLSLLGTFLQPGDSRRFFAATSGDGVYHTYSPTAVSSAVNNVFDASFSASGGAGIGSVDSLNTALFGLNFVNDGPYSYNLTVQLDYTLSARARGEFASSEVLFDYWDEAETLAGSDYLSSITYSGWLDDSQSSHALVSWQFMLNPGDQQQLYAQASVLSHVESAQISSVPIPASLWLFASALLGLKRLGRSSSHV
ncbi:MAG: hypothetical protein PHH11_00105 [Methylomonas sp.]|nr:hypothetical protein [Methylomonas sp.]